MGRRKSVPAIVAAALVSLALLTVFAIELSDTQAGSKADVKVRVSERAVLAAALIHSLFESILQAIPQDSRTFGSRLVSTATMDGSSQQGYLVLVDDTGSVIAHTSSGFTAQARAALASSAALAFIRMGSPYGVGNLSPYGTTGVIDLAVTFPTPYGMRTLVTGFLPAALEAVVGDDLRTIPGPSGSYNYLVDARHDVIASTNPAIPPGDAFQTPDELRALAHEATDVGGRYYDQVQLAGSTWRLVLSSPDGPLFASVDGLREWVPWAIFAALGLVALAAGLLGVRVLGRSEQVRAANLQLEQASRAKDLFVSRMSHELRTPLNAILGFTGILLMGLPGPLNDEQVGQLRTVQRNSRHLLSLINDLLDLGRIQSGKVETGHEPVDCRELVEEVAVGLRPLAEEKGLALEVVVGPDPVVVSSDARAIRQILINLANNAIKFTAAGTVRIELARRRDDGHDVVRFAVVDTGPGIAPADRERLFAAFEQGGDGETSEFEGTGLGLYISKSLAELIDGRLVLESVLGEGATFALELPADQPRPDTSREANKGPDAAIRE